MEGKDLSLLVSETKKFLSPYLQELFNFHFSFYNPLFWAAVILLFVILSSFWTAKKAFSFCGVFALILLASTRVEALTAGMLGGYPTVKTLTVVLIIAVILYYGFIKGDDL